MTSKTFQVVRPMLFALGFLILSWAIFAFVAFGIFTRSDAHTIPIILTWALFSLVILVLGISKGYFDKFFFSYLSIFVLILMGLYLVPLYNMPQEALDLNSQISENNEDRYAYAEELFFAIEQKWTTPTRQYLLEPHRVFFIKSINYFWNTEGYVDSNTQARIYRDLLLESERFDEDEIELQIGWCANSPHTSVYFPEKDAYADLWAVDHFEDYEFGMVVVRPCDELTGEPLP